jgi:hypothetical protein
MTGALVRVVGDADLGCDPPTAGAVFTLHGAENLARVALGHPMFGAGYRATDDLTVDQLGALVRVSDEVCDGV